MSKKLDKAMNFYLESIRDGRVVEHWDNVEPVPEENVNSGKF